MTTSKMMTVLALAFITAVCGCAYETASLNSIENLPAATAAPVADEPVAMVRVPTALPAQAADGVEAAAPLTAEQVAQIVRQELERTRQPATEPQAAVEPEKAAGACECAACVAAREAVAQQAAAAAAATAAEPQVVVVEVAEKDSFYDELDQYGDWVYAESYGRVWRPRVATTSSSWRPYCNDGRWVWTDQGWYWQSLYPWGRVVFHYGRWTYLSGYRWVWVPDRVWGPAWVHWRNDSGYYGWAPLPPGAHYADGIGLTYRGSHATLDAQLGLMDWHYVFVPRDRLLDHRVHETALPRSSVRQVYAKSTVIKTDAYRRDGRTVISGGPSHTVSSVNTSRRTSAVREIVAKQTSSALGSNVRPAAPSTTTQVTTTTTTDYRSGRLAPASAASSTVSDNSAGNNGGTTSRTDGSGGGRSSRLSSIARSKMGGK